MLMLGGKLKFKESLSGRLGDVLSHLYMTSAMLKRYHDEGAPQADQPLLAWAFHDSVHRIETALSGALRNFPIRPVGWVLWALVFPWGRRAQAPSDRLGHRVAALLLTPSDTRDRLAEGDRADRLLGLALTRIRRAGLLKGRVTQRTDSTHVLSAARELTRLELACEAVRAVGLEPTSPPTRGGTDGSRLTEMGLPTPNLFAGYHNPHGPLEWAVVQEMQQSLQMCIELVQLWEQKGVGYKGRPRKKRRRTAA